jgi:hypothetical protein
MPSSAYELVLCGMACIWELFSCAEHPQGGQASKARTSIRSRALGVENRVHSSLTDTRVQGVRKAFCHIPDRRVPDVLHRPRAGVYTSDARDGEVPDQS